MDDFEKEFQEGREINNSINNKTIIVIMIVGIAIFLIGLLFVSKMGIKTEKQKEQENLAAQEAQIKKYSVQLTKEEDFYQKPFLFYEGICYVTLNAGLDKEFVDEKLGATTSMFSYTKAKSTVTDGMRYGLTEGQEYFSVKDESNIIAVLGNNQYHVFVNEDFYDIYQKGEDFEKIISTEELLKVELEVGINGTKEKSLTITNKMFEYIIDNFKIQEYKMSSTSYKDNIATNAFITTNNGITYKYIFGYSVEDKNIFCYRYTTGDNTAYVFTGGKDEDLNAEIFEIFANE